MNMSDKIKFPERKTQNENSIESEGISSQDILNLFDSSSSMELKIKKDIWDSLYSNNFNNIVIKSILNSRNSRYQKSKHSLSVLLRYIDKSIGNKNLQPGVIDLFNQIDKTRDKHLSKALQIVFDALSDQFVKVENAATPDEVSNSIQEPVESSNKPDYSDLEQYLSYQKPNKQVKKEKYKPTTKFTDRDIDELSEGLTRR